jgi:hypothetical protein
MNDDSTGVIRITKEDATSAHVDGLLKRQMSMRGDPGVTRDRRRRWYAQNWLLLAIAGMVGAILAWALLEPFFDDQLYVQGTVTELKLRDRLPDRVVDEDTGEELDASVLGSLSINGERILLFKGTREITPGGNRRLNVRDLKEGETLGLHVEYVRGDEQDLVFAIFVERSPKPLEASRAAMTLSQLQARSRAASIFLFPLVAGLIGLCIGAVDGLICRLPRRALVCGGVGLVVGVTGGFVCSILANLAYAPLHDLALRQMDKGGTALGAFGFLVQTVGRSLAWALAGMAMGLGQGIALRSQRLLLYGLFGGVLGGLFGGLLFDPIDTILIGPDKPSAHLARLIGFAVIGLGVGGMIGVVELLARDAWLRMTQGPLTGKEFLLFKDTMNIGASPRSDLYLFNDPLVAKQHAVIRAMGDECEIEALETTSPVLLNNRPVRRARLRHGDNITIGRTSFVFQRRKG